MAGAQHRYFIFDTPAGFCAIAWHDAGITRLQLPMHSEPAAERLLLQRLPMASSAAPPPEVAAVIAAIKRYFAGDKIDFSDVRLDLGGQEELFRRIYEAVRRVGWGQTTTYGTLAKELGAGPEGARDVGQAMARNPVPLIIPCHRVLAAGGKLGGFSAAGGVTTKTHMLALEGVALEPPPPTQHALL